MRRVQTHADVELSRAARDALVALLLADLAWEGPSRVQIALRVLTGPGDGAAGDAKAGGARDIRAALASVGLVPAAPAPGRSSPEGRDPSPVATARRRLHLYGDALERAPRGSDVATRLGQARALLAQALFFEVHEVLEPAWRVAAGEDRLLLQGIIQASVAWYHGERGRSAPALRAATAAAAKLADAPGRWQGFPIDRLRVPLVAYRDALARGGAPQPPSLAL